MRLQCTVCQGQYEFSFQKPKSLLCMGPYFILRFGEICHVQLQPHHGEKTDRAVGVCDAVVAALRFGRGDRRGWGWGGSGCGSGARNIG